MGVRVGHALMRLLHAQLLEEQAQKRYELLLYALNT
jgi:hypothetical protein